MVIIDNISVEKKLYYQKNLKMINKHDFFFKKTNLIINAIGDLGEIKNILSLDLKKFEKTLK